jgi:hypothetical protein
VLCALAGVNPYVPVFQIPEKLRRQRKFSSILVRRARS